MDGSVARVTVPLRVAVQLVLPWVGWTLVALAVPGAALGADPTPTPPADGGDPRSSGQGPGFVGQPLLAIAVVFAVAIVAVAVTLAYVRLTEDRSRR